MQIKVVTTKEYQLYINKTTLKSAKSREVKEMFSKMLYQAFLDGISFRDSKLVVEV